MSEVETEKKRNWALWLSNAVLLFMLMFFALLWWMMPVIERIRLKNPLYTPNTIEISLDVLEWGPSLTAFIVLTMCTDHLHRKREKNRGNRLLVVDDELSELEQIRAWFLFRVIGTCVLTLLAWVCWWGFCYSWFGPFSDPLSEFQTWLDIALFISSLLLLFFSGNLCWWLGDSWFDYHVFKGLSKEELDEINKILSRHDEPTTTNVEEEDE